MKSEVQRGLDEGRIEKRECWMKVRNEGEKGQRELNAVTNKRRES